MRLVSAGWVMCSDSAAREKFSSRASVMNDSICTDDKRVVTQFSRSLPHANHNIGLLRHS